MDGSLALVAVALLVLGGLGGAAVVVAHVVRGRREGSQLAAEVAATEADCAHLVASLSEREEPPTEAEAVALRERLRIQRDSRGETSRPVLLEGDVRVTPFPNDRALLRDVLPLLDAIGRVKVGDAEKDRASLRVSVYGNARTRGSLRVGDVRRAQRLAARIRESVR